MQHEAKMKIKCICLFSAPPEVNTNFILLTCNKRQRSEGQNPLSWSPFVQSISDFSRLFQRHLSLEEEIHI